MIEMPEDGGAGRQGVRRGVRLDGRRDQPRDRERSTARSASGPRCAGAAMSAARRPTRSSRRTSRAACASRRSRWSACRILRHEATRDQGIPHDLNIMYDRRVPTASATPSARRVTADRRAGGREQGELEATWSRPTGRASPPSGSPSLIERRSTRGDRRRGWRRRGGGGGSRQEAARGRRRRRRRRRGRRREGGG